MDKFDWHVGCGHTLHLESNKASLLHYYSHGIEHSPLDVKIMELNLKRLFFVGDA